MFEEEMPESDSSDEDFVPTGQASDVSEEESDNAEPEDQEVEAQSVTKKRKKVKSSKANRRKKKKADEEEADDIVEEKIEEPVKEESAEEKKKKADSLWADFLKDVPTVKKKPDTPQNNKPEERPENSETNNVSDRLEPEVSSGSSTTSDNTERSSKSEKVVEVFEFAGEKVVVEKKVDPRKRPLVRGGGVVGRGGGAAAILNQLNKKNKLSTLEKSKLDWESFKEKEGINEQLSAHNRGKNGYLEKQDFLERADMRQFEIEKQMRAHTRSKRV